MVTNQRPEVLVLDVNETLSDLEPLRARFEAVGMPGHALDAWFAATLRDGFALTAAGSYAAFRTIGSDLLHSMLVGAGLDATDEVISSVLSGFTQLHAHPDVAPGLTRLRELGFRLITLTNGAAAMSEQMFAEAGVLQLLEHRLDVEKPGRWKPDAAAYRYAAEVCKTEVDRMALVAVHPWDIDGARRAGLLGYYLDRRRTPYPQAFLPADLTAPDLESLADRLAMA
ncbi:2-haloacid dehalogenase [Kribbella antiqua]|uniref:2-haloacid dehalogenase n=1 Tax=Kribbella antiqua TaxID=2512217 RepID=A0A4R2IDU1_9ACTN|nr:haloacid dehalogenase type II [Kribbella antiqua]TCO42487.1 2-haloacid dehalogenase [Kribbella antiqua]